MTREIRVVYRDRDIAGFTERGADPKWWVFFTTTGRLTAHVTAHDPSSDFPTGVVRLSHDRVKKRGPTIGIGFITLGSELDPQRGVPRSTYVGTAAEQDDMISLGTLVCPVGDEDLPAYRKSSNRPETQLVIPARDLQILTINAFLVPPRAQTQATAERHFPDDTFEVMVIESSRDVGMMLRVRFEL